MQAEAKGAKYKAGKRTDYVKDDSGKWRIERVIKYKYNKKGLLTSKTDTDSDGDVGKTTYTYNKKRKIKTEKTTRNGKKYDSYSYTYKGNKLKRVTYKEYENGKVAYREVTEYKNNKPKTVYKYHNGRKKYNSKDVYIYKNGQLAEIKSYDKRKKYVCSDIYTYIGKTKKTMKRVYPNEQPELMEEYEYVYDGNHLVSEKETDIYSGNVTITEYDKRDNMTRYCITYKGGYTLDDYYEYKYDKNNRLVEETSKSYEDGTLASEEKLVYSDWKK